MVSCSAPRGANSTTLLMKRIIGIVFIVLGLVVFFQGLNRKDSLAGEAAEAGTQIANSLDGGARTPKHVVYMIVGGVLTVVGLGMTFSRGPRLTR